MDQVIVWQFGALSLALLILLTWFLFMMWRFTVQQSRLLRSVKISLNKIEYYLERGGLKPQKPAKDKKGHLIREEVRELEILKNEPMAKYAAVSMPDDVKISFVDQEEE